MTHRSARPFLLQVRPPYLSPPLKRPFRGLDDEKAAERIRKRAPTSSRVHRGRTSGLESPPARSLSPARPASGAPPRSPVRPGRTAREPRGRLAEAGRATCPRARALTAGVQGHSPTPARGRGAESGAGPDASGRSRAATRRSPRPSPRVPASMSPGSGPNRHLELPLGRRAAGWHAYGSRARRAGRRCRQFTCRHLGAGCLPRPPSTPRGSDRKRMRPHRGAPWDREGRPQAPGRAEVTGAEGGKRHRRS